MDNFTQQFSQFAVVVIITPLTIIYYTLLLSEVIDYVGPLSVFGYFIAGLVINKLLMTPIVGIVFNKVLVKVK